MSFVSDINALIVDTLGPTGPLLVTGALGVLLILIALPSFLNRKADPLDKLRESIARTNSRAEGQKTLRSVDYAEKLEKFAHFLEPQKAEEMGAARLKLMRAGYRQKTAVRNFHAAQFALGLSLLAVGVIYTLLNNDDTTPPSATNLMLTALLPGVAGYFLPSYWVERRVQSRREEMVNGFPDSLDMMLVCVEAGQSLDQAIIRVSKEIKLGYPALGEEYELVAQEIKAGKERAQVLRDFGERSGVPDIASFVTTMVQSATFGTSIAEALRIYAAEMRDKRVMRAEEKANVLPTKLTLGTMLFTVPPLLVVLIGPSIYGIATTLGGGAF
ncbi:tight adherence protein C [Gemmobacter megaterium]|uniref:Tight adherence protein C n=1 Tax=Gemmobacter megaterium TaxID=1086013 RepID=A0A1N7NPL7_9RHOB|nr:type II secretion system F family protein [Gemmobacter megaterium]GGE17504.1 pilus assembly protein TadC [Gemmobacter megaterium]SIT00252.1 tight adherence protein C [Gemmobacter megaterium]